MKKDYPPFRFPATKIFRLRERRRRERVRGGVSFYSNGHVHGERFREPIFEKEERSCRERACD
ncbi:MAG: hypothetical protein ACI4QA_07905 [Candidatus Spyradosoma sp.]